MEQLSVNDLGGLAGGGAFVLMVLFVVLHYFVLPVMRDRHKKNGNGNGSFKANDTNQELVTKFLTAGLEHITESNQILRQTYEWMKPTPEGRQDWRVTEAPFYKEKLSNIDAVTVETDKKVDAALAKLATIDETTTDTLKTLQEILHQLERQNSGRSDREAG